MDELLRKRGLKSYSYSAPRDVYVSVNKLSITPSEVWFYNLENVPIKSGFFRFIEISSLGKIPPADSPHLECCAKPEKFVYRLGVRALLMAPLLTISIEFRKRKVAAFKCRGPRCKNGDFRQMRS